ALPDLRNPMFGIGDELEREWHLGNKRHQIPAGNPCCHIEGDIQRPSEVRHTPGVKWRWRIGQERFVAALVNRLWLKANLDGELPSPGVAIHSAFGSFCDEEPVAKLKDLLADPNLDVKVLVHWLRRPR